MLGKSTKPVALNERNKNDDSSIAEEHIAGHVDNDLPAKVQSKSSFARTLVKVKAPLLTPKRSSAHSAGINGEEAAASAPASRRNHSAPHRDTSARKAKPQTTVAHAPEKAVAPPQPLPAQVPTPDGVAAELWRIATGDGSESARVSALRALADIFGMLRAQPQELPEAMSLLLDALSRGLGGDPVEQGGTDISADLPVIHNARVPRPAAPLRTPG